MATSVSANSKRVSEQFRDFPKVPIRHRKILDKLARCSICDRLCCCIEHCLTHERKHSETEREKTGTGTSKTHEWVEASESTLTSRVVKSEFPFFCVYCSIKVQDEFALRHLMGHGPWCTVKKCHWMVPLAVYHEVNKENETREMHMDVTQARGACNFPRLTPRKTPERSLLRTALSNCLQSAMRTPPVTPAAGGECGGGGGAAGAVVAVGAGAASGPLLTSTPEDDGHAASAAAVAVATAMEASLSPAPYLQTPRATPQSKTTPATQPTGILSCSPRNKLRRTRKVTFSCDHEVPKLKSPLQDSGGGGGGGGENENEGNAKGDGGRLNKR